MQAAFAGQIRTDQLWGKTQNIKVCFANNFDEIRDIKLEHQSYYVEPVPFPEDLKKLIIEATSQSFSTSQTGISFSGFDTCDGTADLVIFYTGDRTGTFSRDEEPEYSNFSSSIGKPKNQKPYIQINETYIKGIRKDNLPLDFIHFAKTVYGRTKWVEKSWNEFGKYSAVQSVIHELGHIAGLLHEQGDSSLEDLRQYDVTFNKNYSSELFDNWIPEYPVYHDGLAYPLSTMHYYRMTYALDAEINYLMCASIRQNKYSKRDENLFRFMFSKLSKKLFSISEFNHTFCQDESYHRLRPQYAFEHGIILDAKSQALLRKFYQASSSNIQSTPDTDLLKYILEKWVPLTSVIWGQY